MRQIGTDGRSLAAVLAAAGALLATIAPAQAEKLTVETATRAGGLLRDIGASFEVVSTAASGIIMAIPTVWPEMIKAREAIFAPIEGARSIGATGALIALSLGLCLAAALLVRLATTSLRRHWVSDTVGARGALGLFLLDALAALAFAVAGFVLARVWFSHDDLHDRFALAFIWAAVRWCLSMLAVVVILRPRHKNLRLIRVTTAGAVELTILAGVLLFIGVIVIELAPVYLAAGLPIPAGQFVVFATGVLIALGGIIGSSRLYQHHKVARAAEDAPRSTGPAIWLGIAIFFVVLLWATWSGGILFLDFAIYHSLAWSLVIAGLTFIVDRVMGLSERAIAEIPETDDRRAGFLLRWLPVLRRAIRVGAAFAIIVILAEVWLVSQLDLVPAERWTDVRHSLITAAVTLFVGYVVWTIVHRWTERRIGLQGALDPDSEEAAGKPASRLTTLLPLFRILLGISILVMTVLITLSQLGVDIGPLVAGAGIFGLALSFGSQALVKDIVSGIFFIADDAFRVGEYIDTGKLKGTVEKISLRSLRLRHQNGQIHTVPYGELSAITNFSRDWATMKFNIRLARDTDLEKVRKTIKQVGLAMMEEPELKPEFLQPLKMQGVADIADTALVIRCKFTVRPVKLTWVQRESLKRLHKAFAEKGIAFASGTVTVQSAGGSVEAAAAAAAATALQRAALDAPTAPQPT